MLNVKFLVMDVDGTLTDGMIYMGKSGEVMKAFNVKDGYGIKNVLPQYDIIPIIITARESRILEMRCAELGIKEVHQGCTEKLDKLKKIIARYSDAEKIGFGDVAYIGDDITDLSCMEAVKNGGGFVAAPNDAADEIKKISGYISKRNAGSGAVRDIIEYIVKNDSDSISKEEYSKRIEYALNYIRKLDKNQIEIGKYIVNDFFYYMVQEYATKSEEMCSFESHNFHVDIQWIMEGAESIETCDNNNIEVSIPYDKQTDVTFFCERGLVKKERIELHAGSFIIIPEKRIHKTCIKCEGAVVKKVVGKISIV